MIYRIGSDVSVVEFPQVSMVKMIHCITCCTTPERLTDPFSVF